jgi:hypothetical protein
VKQTQPARRKCQFAIVIPTNEHAEVQPLGYDHFRLLEFFYSEFFGASNRHDFRVFTVNAFQNGELLPVEFGHPPMVGGATELSAQKWAGLHKKGIGGILAGRARSELVQICSILCKANIV